EQARLFEPFSQADAATNRRFGGTGLGLAISRRLAEAMGGRIGVDSRAGEGAGFWFTTTFAVPAAHLDNRLAVVHEDAAATPAKGSTTRRVLIAEDDRINQLLIATMLNRWGFETVVVDDGAAALEALGREPFDVVVMDVNMPVLDGPSAVRRLRAEGGPLAALPVFALTADVVADHMERFREAGFTDVMPKPIDWARLRGALETSVARDG
ncbi:MAG: response regulator, partial [Alphaproteobacteria bacterium]